MHKPKKPLDVDPSVSLEQPVCLEVLVAFLKTGRDIDRASSVLLLATMLLLLFQGPPYARSGMIVALFLWLLAKYFACRVSLDAKLFEILIRHPEKIEQFDAAMTRMVKPRTVHHGRSGDSRWNGVRRLFFCQILLTTAQVVALALLCMQYLQSAYA